MKNIPVISKIGKTTLKLAFWTALGVPVSVAAFNFASLGLRQDAPSPQTDDIKAGVLVVIARDNGEQIVLTTSNGPLPVGSGIREEHDLRDQYRSLDELEEASIAIIETNDSIGLRGVRVIERDIIDGDVVSASFGAEPQACDQTRCVPVFTANLGNDILDGIAVDGLREEFDRARDLQEEYDEPEIQILGLGHIGRKIEKEFFDIGFVKSTSDFLHRWGIG